MRLIVNVVFSALLAAFLVACGDKGQEAADRAPDSGAALTVSVTEMKGQPLYESVLATGTVVPWRELPIGSETGGLSVVEVLVDEGDQVRKGQLLARLDDSLLKAQIAQQEASVAEAAANLKFAQSDLDRAKKLSGASMSKQVLEQRTTSVETTQARLGTAQALMDQMTTRLEQTQIVAPSDGIVLKRTATIGQIVQAGGELFELIEDGRLEVDAEVPEADFLRVKPGQQVSIIDPLGQASSGEVRATAPEVDSKTRLGIVHIAIGDDSALKPGMFARAKINVGDRIGLAVKPQALVWRNGNPGVFTLGAANTVTFKPVTMGRQSDDLIEILKGVTAGDTVVVEGAGFLSDGDTVRVAAAEEATRQTQ